MSERRRLGWTSAEKLRIVEESLTGEASVAEFARRHDVHPNLLHLWRRQAPQRGAPSIAGAGPGSRFVSVAVGPAGGARAVRNARCRPRTGDRGEVLRNGRALLLRGRGVLPPARAVALADALEED